MRNIRLREFRKLDFRDPRPFLTNLRRLELGGTLAGLPPEVRSLRTNELKHWREKREAAIFCYGVSQIVGTTVYFAPTEEQDHDFVATWSDDETQHFAPVQLKEVVPQNLNDTASVQRVIDSLSKYVDSGDLTVAIHLNQEGRFDPTTLDVPNLSLSGLWVFCATARDQSRWGLWGNLFTNRSGIEFSYPISGND